MTGSRRRLLRGCLCCAALAATGCVQTETTVGLNPGFRPDSATLEGGLWRTMERQEERIADSPNRIRDRAVTDHVEEIVGRLAGEHRRDIRVYVVRAAGFNASMAPNGMMQVWTGLLLRTQTESQLAAVLGHEIAHYTRRHTLARFQQARGAADVAALLGVGFGAAGLLVGVAAMAGVAAFSREQEAEADALGLALLNAAGYDAGEAPALWDNLLAEGRLRPDRTRLPLFATHPASDDRAAALREALGTLPAAPRGPDRALRRSLRGIWPTLVADELRLGQYAASIELFRQAEAAGNGDGALYAAWGEALRLRNEAGDADRALATFRRAVAEADAPPEAWRGLGLVLRRAGDQPAARAAFRTYLARAPLANDAPLIRSYLDDAGS